jgi:aspartate aminotransferase
MKLSDRMSRIQPSATLAVAARAAQMKRDGIDVISLTLGEPDFPSVPAAKAAGIAAIEQDFTRYTPVKGIPELVEEVAAWTGKRYGVEVTPEQVVISSGAKQCLYDLAVSLWQEGDEILIFSPYWVSYPDQARLVGASTVTVRTSPDDGFRIPLDRVRQAINDRTVAMVINNPSNPTGAVLPREDIEGLAALAVEHDLTIIADSIYDPIVFDGVEVVNPLSLGPEVAARTCLVHGVSKAYSMTGWRIGFLVAPADVAKACTKVQGQCTSNPCSISQRATLGALRGSQDPVQMMVDTYAQRRKWLLERVTRIRGLNIPVPPQGAFYIFPEVSSLIGRTTPTGRLLSSSVDVSEYLLIEAKVASVPGAAFGEDSCIRFSYAASMDDLTAAMDRIDSLLSPWV